MLIDIEIKSKKWQAEENIADFIEKIAKKLVSETDIKKIADRELELAISLVSDAQMKKINHEFRGKNKATNVLSFASLDENLIRKFGLKKAAGAQKYLFLGDIVISYDTLKKEAKAQEKPFRNHLTHLILHSILHLIGFDHEDEEMAKIMENLEIKILKKFKISNPY